mmetsp:Transcript_2313/g.4198  ORF Transcript_2313/g.4198 Transcript_2313/m.4198 type:complete len:97 (+) Transcript_2313:74-364(+)|eukprot:CAMPEP_0197623656 /NCGR_PEP_ID=MMETSP1338-20131121/3625_1 /TAXON_ID=43686 ORGANISM="Pelagodinium beii, Strain RCC1491" /NCGR_SAMPLE_ID=MMETSP1338 /ASSEMBLY_ACC=CAM_ASM_000754 /LENGTH=96 /DNA_ID=CAMNT_0043193699 /DNA_START=68 /DNA_END=358 /DNA_ORIENTATION=-
MARGRSFLLSAICVCLLVAFAGMAFVPPAEPASSLRGARMEGAEAAMLGAVVAAAPQAAYAGAAGYGLLQLGWAVFVISLGPAVLFWIYFNKPELL